MPGIPMICPVCSSTFPVEAGVQDVEARRALAAAVALWPAPIQQHALVYLGLFGPQSRRISWAKFARIVTELVELIKSGSVTRDRETRAAPLALWGEGLEAIMEMRDKGTLGLPLEGHGLLCEIVHRKAAKAQIAQSAATRPLHPSHRPAEVSEGGRAAGAQHVSALLGKLGKPGKPGRLAEDGD